MANNPDAKRPIIIRRKKVIAAGHHGGAWKVAYADFVTAMMAFFMVMWLVSTVSKEQRAALFDYFSNPSLESGKAARPAPGQAGPGGASTSPINLRGGLDSPRTFSQVPDIGGPVAPIGPTELNPPPDVAEAQRITEAAERRQLESLLDELREAISKSQALEPFKDQLLLDITPEGLRIQIVDAQNRPMFDLGGSRLKNYTEKILRELSPYLSSVPNRISLTGHTDTTPYSARADYTNWELSADRANAARRALERGGLAADKVTRVVGLSSSVLFDKAEPRNPINRRISIIVMTRRTEEAALKSDVLVSPTETAAPVADQHTDPTPAAGSPALDPPRLDPMADQALPQSTGKTPAWLPPVPSVAPPQPTIASALETAAATQAILEKQKKP